MAKIIPQSLKFVDIVMQISDTKQLALCADCQEEMVITSAVLVELSDYPEAKSLTHNLLCPKCNGISYIALRTK